MKQYIMNRMGEYCSLQISQLKDIEGDYESKSPFLIKNISGDSLQLQLKLVNNSSYIETFIDEGWNPEICEGVKGITGKGLIQIGK